jgi:hypothetical protein
MRTRIHAQLHTLPRLFACLSLCPRAHLHACDCVHALKHASTVLIRITCWFCSCCCWWFRGGYSGPGAAEKPIQELAHPLFVYVHCGNNRCHCCNSARKLAGERDRIQGARIRQGAQMPCMHLSDTNASSTSAWTKHDSLALWNQGSVPPSEGSDES